MDDVALVQEPIGESVKSSPIFTISILTYNRVATVLELVKSLEALQGPDCEIVVVDNGSADGTSKKLREQFSYIKLITLPRNLGVGARNLGMQCARGEIVVTLDDDILGVDSASLSHLKREFDNNEHLGALCFQVKEYPTGEVCNWCHPYSKEEFSERKFLTTEISEGAVALRKAILAKTGGYPDDFFISHEGADLAARIMNHGYEVRYTPHVVVWHKYAIAGRKNWRRYYYDTRNDFWLVIRNYSFWYGLKYLARRTSVMLVYSLRDGFFRYWAKAIFDVGSELPKILAQRNPISKETENRIRRINGYRPGIRYYVEKRFGQRRVRI